MNGLQLRRMLELIDNLVNLEGTTWQEKRDAILAESDEHDKDNLAELADWFARLT